MFFSPEAFLFGFIQGFVVGPITLYGIEEGLDPKKGVRYQLQVILGATMVDTVYLILATYGAARFIQAPSIQFVMWSIAAFMLITMGYNSLRARQKRLSFHHMHRHKIKFYETDFVRGFLMNLVNPMAIVFYVMVVGSLYSEIGGTLSPLAFAMNINASSFLSSLIVLGATMLVRQIFRPWMLKKLIQLGSFALIGYGVFFSWKAVLQIGPFLKAALLFE